MGMHHLTTLSVTFEDGFSVGTTKVNDTFRARQPDTPEKAALLDFLLSPSVPMARATLRERFADESGNALEERTSPASFDPRELHNYILARSSSKTAVSSVPVIDPATGQRIISVAAPVFKENVFQGALAASAAVTQIARFLYLNRVSPRTLIAIINDSEQVIVPPLSAASDGSGVLNEELESELMRVEPRVSEALQKLGEDAAEITMKSASIGDIEYTLSLTPIPNHFNLPWRLLIATPDSDFIGPLQQARSFIAWLVVAIVPLQLLLIRKLSLRVSHGIVGMASSLRQIRMMNFDEPRKTTRLFTREIAELSDGITLLQNALRSFAQYIPVGVVKQLIAKGQPLELGVEERKLAILFTDLENFSTVSQSISPDQLLTQLSEMFSMMTGAISEELGTVDKFIGDSVMAFWGAPTETDHSPLRACRAALRMRYRISKLNERWRKEGKPTLRVRIGIHYAAVLVGNIGTSERLSYTALGDGVNVASRLEGINKRFNSEICASDLVYNEVSDLVIARPLDEVSVKGRVGAFSVYEILGIRDSDDPELVARATSDSG